MAGVKKPINLFRVKPFWLTGGREIMAYLAIRQWKTLYKYRDAGLPVHHLNQRSIKAFTAEIDLWLMQR
jgi:hypothetical protein